MAYKTSALRKTAIEAIITKKLIFIEEIVSYLPCHKSTFYDHFPDDSNAYKEITTLLDKNKDEIKASLRAKWYKSDNATLQIALMRLCATDPERRKLAMNYMEHTGRDGKDLIPSLSDEELEKQINKILNPEG